MREGLHGMLDIMGYVGYHGICWISWNDRYYGINEIMGYRGYHGISTISWNIDGYHGI